MTRILSLIIASAFLTIGSAASVQAADLDTGPEVTGYSERCQARYDRCMKWWRKEEWCEQRAQRCEEWQARWNKFWSRGRHAHGRDVTK